MNMILLHLTWESEIYIMSMFNWGTVAGGHEYLIFGALTINHYIKGIVL